MATKTDAKEPTAVRQITLAEMGADGKDAIREGKPVFMGRIFGSVSSTKVMEGKNDSRPYHVLIGDFQGINAAGEVFQSEKCILPGQTGEKIVADASAAATKGEALEFAIDIFSNPDTAGKKSPLGYGFTSTSLIETASTSRLRELEARLNSKALPNKAKAAVK
jgi:hypothetical protein